mgnify:CR=1 FL=1
MSSEISRIAVEGTPSSSLDTDRGRETDREASVSRWETGPESRETDRETAAQARQKQGGMCVEPLQADFLQGDDVARLTVLRLRTHTLLDRGSRQRDRERTRDRQQAERHRHKERQADRETGGQASSQPGSQAARQAHKHIHTQRETDRQRHREKDKRRQRQRRRGRQRLKEGGYLVDDAVSALTDLLELLVCLHLHSTAASAVGAVSAPQQGQISAVLHLLPVCVGVRGYPCPNLVKSSSCHPPDLNLCLPRCLSLWLWLALAGSWHCHCC